MKKYGIDFKYAFSNDELKIVGEFIFPENNNYNLENHLQKSIVMTLMYNTGYSVSNIFEDIIIFKDDVNIINNDITGFFNLDLTDTINDIGVNEIYLMFSMGPYLSKVEVIKI